MRRRLPGRLIGALVVTAALLLAAAPAARADTSLEAAATGTPGVYEFLGRGFRPRETNSVWLTSPTGAVIAIPSVMSNKNGEVFFTHLMPRHYPGGRWAITVEARQSGRQAIAYFDVTAREPDIELSVSQPSGPPGSSFDFASVQFQPGEVVSYWASGPSGQTSEAGYVTADLATGRVDFSFTVPADAEPGVWTMAAYGESSDHFGVAPFTIVP
jgi:hypothetical protein